MKRIIKFLLLLITVSCTNNLSVQTSGDFSVSALPYKSSVAVNETREIDIQIIPTIQYKYPTYTIMYFQESGDGVLSLDDGSILQINRKYLLTKNSFSIFYKSLKSSAHTFTLYLEDSESNRHTLRISLSNDTGS